MPRGGFFLLLWLLPAALPLRVSVSAPFFREGWVSFRLRAGAPFLFFFASRDGLTGFSRKSKAPILMADTAVCTSPYPVMMMTGISCRCSLSQASSSIPSPSGRRRSHSTSRYSCFASSSLAVCRSCFQTGAYPLRSNHLRSMIPKVASSSTINIFLFIARVELSGKDKLFIFFMET